MKNNSGFTLIEMMVVIFVLMVLVGLAGPYFGELIRNNRIQTSTQILFSTLVTARSEAVKRNHSVSACKSADGSTCTAAGDWTQGWIIFADEDNDGVKDAGEEVILVQALVSKGVILRATGNFADLIRFQGDGTIDGAEDDFWVCDTGNSVDARKVAISNTGRPSREKTTDNCPSS